MNNEKFVIEKVSERDIDLFVINKFLNDKKFKDLFLQKIEKTKYEIEQCIHSYSDNDGENDITVILKKNAHKIALLIENKVNALAMPKQRNRYYIRGNSGVRQNKYNDFFVFIIAPQDYLNNNTEAKKYEYKISYEEILEYLGSNDSYGTTLLEVAINEKKKGYSVIEDKNVTSFWKKYYDYIDKYYPTLSIKKYEGPRGKKAWWPSFFIPVKKIRIDHKTNKGFVDMSFSGVGDYFSEVSNILDDKLDEDMMIIKTGKSMSIRVKVPVVNFNENFNKYTNDIKICLDVVKRLQDLLPKIDYKKILNLNK